MPTVKTALLLIAHGSREPEANGDLYALADQLRRDQAYLCVEASFLELAQPGIEEGAWRCVVQGAERVILLPYFLSAGVHVRRDLTACRERLAAQFRQIDFRLAQPLGRHRLLVEIVRARAAESAEGNAS